MTRTNSTDILANLRSALQTLEQTTQVIPASGRAQEDLDRMDPEEAADRELMRQSVVVDIRETKNTRLYIPLRPVPRTEENFFNHFVDGCIKTHFLGTILSGSQETDVRMAQVGAAALWRDPRGNLHGPGNHCYFELLLMIDQSLIPEGTWAELEKRTSGMKCGPFVMRLQNVQPTKDGPQRNESSQKANGRMASCERQIVENLLKERPPGSPWIIADGNISSELRVKSTEGLVGVVKRFSMHVDFKLGGEARSRKLAQVLETLEASSRTAAFAHPNRPVAFWYIRLRQQERLDYPLMGVVKIELPVNDGEDLDSEFVDRISGAIVAERSVSTYSRDPRWHSHLYPIHCAEQAIKSRFFTKDILRWGLDWNKIFE